MSSPFPLTAEGWFAIPRKQGFPGRRRRAVYFPRRDPGARGDFLPVQSRRAPGTVEPLVVPGHDGDHLPHRRDRPEGPRPGANRSPSSAGRTPCGMRCTPPGPPAPSPGVRRAHPRRFRDRMDADGREDADDRHDDRGAGEGEASLRSGQPHGKLIGRAVENFILRIEFFFWIPPCPAGCRRSRPWGGGGFALTGSFGSWKIPVYKVGE